MFSYDVLVSRNWGFIDSNLQKKMQGIRVLLAGCGIGSVISTLAVRTGFEQFILADGDVVELSNLNRQSFTINQVGKNKALALDENLKQINPKMKNEVCPYFITVSNVAEHVAKADIVINTIDLDSPEFLLLNTEAQKQDKIVIFPANLGWVGTVLIFNKKSVSLEKMLFKSNEQREQVDISKRIIEIIISQNKIPSYLLSLVKKFKNKTKESWPCDPQLGLSAYLTSSLAVSSMLQILLGKKVKLAPYVNKFDAWFEIGTRPGIFKRIMYKLYSSLVEKYS